MGLSGRAAQRPEPEIITFSAPYFGRPYNSHRAATKASPFLTQALPQHGLYRWHLPDPIYFDEALKVTLHQIGAWDQVLFERTDDTRGLSQERCKWLYRPQGQEESR